MAYIRVDHSKFKDAAAATDEYVNVLKNKMRMAQSELFTLSIMWKGSDFNQFKNEFNKVDNEDSVHENMVGALTAYSSFLKSAASKYKEAQARAVNRANQLPRW